MDDKEIRDDDNTIEELTDEDIREYEPGREDPFVSEDEDEVDVFEVNGEMDEFDDELEEDMEPGAAYSSSGKKGRFLFRDFSDCHSCLPDGWEYYWWS